MISNLKFGSNMSKVEIFTNTSFSLMIRVVKNYEFESPTNITYSLLYLPIKKIIFHNFFLIIFLIVFV